MSSLQQTQKNTKYNPTKSNKCKQTKNRKKKQKIIIKHTPKKIRGKLKFSLSNVMSTNRAYFLSMINDP